MVPRVIAPEQSFKSCSEGSRLDSLAVKTSRFSSTCSRLVMISAKPNIPMATITKPMPSDSSGTPNEKRATPEFDAWLCARGILDGDRPGPRFGDPSVVVPA